MTQLANEIGKLIQGWRQEKGVTQKELAHMLKTTQSAVARMESGKQNFTSQLIDQVSEALQRNLLYINGSSINIQVQGEQKLKGSVAVKTSKNGALVLLCASLLNTETTTLHRVPRIEEIFRIIEVLESIGVVIRWKGSSLEIVPPKVWAIEQINRVAAERTRSIIMFLGPLIHHLKNFSLPMAGGCRLGSRSVQPHFYALEKLGVKIKVGEDRYSISSGRLKPTEIILYEAGDTLTANALMAAALVPGITTIKYASANYQVQELCNFLTSLGVLVEGIGSSTLKVHGVKSISAATEYNLAEDPTEAMFFLAAAAVTKSSITIERCPIEFLEIELLTLERMGFRFKATKEYLSENGATRLVDIRTSPSSLTALDEKIAPRPYPGLNIDNLPFFAVIATQAKGTTFLHDWVYEERAIYYKELDKLGGKTLLLDPHRIYITGPSKLIAAEVVCPPALRPSAILLIGMLAAHGTSVLRNIYSINRGYEDIVERLNAIGAKIKIVR